MPRLRLALAQVNPRVGDLDGNAELVLDACRRAAEAGADLVALPEMVLNGYPIEDLASTVNHFPPNRSNHARR